uniref:Uncharacterized protein n=1 Tax=Mesocestoides corti TaxID=53468 RepID=A0A5K3G120_MESCO
MDRSSSGSLMTVDSSSIEQDCSVVDISSDKSESSDCDIELDILSETSSLEILRPDEEVDEPNAVAEMEHGPEKWMRQQELDFSRLKSTAPPIYGACQLREFPSNHDTSLYLPNSVQRQPIVAAASPQQQQNPQPQWYVKLSQMLDNLQNMRSLLTARLHATSDAEDADAIRAAFLACEDADNALRSAGLELAAAKTIQ